MTDDTGQEQPRQERSGQAEPGRPVEDDQLARSYHRLLFAYPRRYRRERGQELVDMYRELAGDRRRPRPADAVDLLLGGLRQRLRAAGLGGIVDGLPVAAVFALAAAGVLSSYYLVTFEPHAFGTVGAPRVGPFATPTSLAYLGWLLTVVTAAALPGRFTRIAAAATLAVLAGVLAMRVLGTPLSFVPLHLLLPLFALGALALAVPASLSWPLRLVPLGATAAALAAAAIRIPLIPPAMGGDDVRVSVWDAPAYLYGACCDYRLAPSYALHVAALALLVAGLLVAGADARRGRGRGAWALLILAGPIAMMEAPRLYSLEPILSLVSLVTGSNEFQVGLAGLLGALVAGLVATLVVGPALRRIRRRATRDEGASA